MYEYNTTILTLPLPLPKKTDRVGSLGICSIPFFTTTNQEIFRSNRSNRSNALEMKLRHALIVHSYCCSITPITLSITPIIVFAFHVARY